MPFSFENSDTASVWNVPCIACSMNLRYVAKEPMNCSENPGSRKRGSKSERASDTHSNALMTCSTPSLSVPSDRGFLREWGSAMAISNVEEKEKEITGHNLKRTNLPIGVSDGREPKNAVGD